MASWLCRWYSEEYDWFYIDGSAQQYTLHASRGTGDAGDSLNAYPNLMNNGKKFFTYDHDNTQKCALMYWGGWWYASCGASRLTAVDNTQNGGGFRWFTLSQLGIVGDGMGMLKACRMMTKATEWQHRVWTCPNVFDMTRMHIVLHFENPIVEIIYGHTALCHSFWRQ